MTVDLERMRQNLGATSGLIMAEAAAAALTPVIGRAAAEEALADACDRAIAEGRTLRETLRDDPTLRPHLSDAALDRLLDPASYLGSAGAFVDRVVARIAALDEL
jgi:3-carboxy-cis,cis-muconate cycloisomerase